MAIKVLITRRFKEGKGMELLILLNQLRSHAIEQPGYLTGETLVGHDDPLKLVVIGTWQTEEHWRKWEDNPERKAMETQIEPLLIEPTKAEVFAWGTFSHRP